MAAIDSGGGFSVGESERGQACEDQWKVREVVVRSVLEEGDRRGELHGAQAEPTAMAAGRRRF